MKYPKDIFDIDIIMRTLRGEITGNQLKGGTIEVFMI